MQILMILTNAYRPDPRVAREATALALAGHHVSIFCWDRRAEYPEHEYQPGVEITRFHGARTSYGLGAKQILHIPRFWLAAYRFALALRPDVIHCHDLDTLFPGVRAKQKIGCSLVYDAHEHYPALMSLYLPAGWVKALARFERSLYREADSVITASSILADEWRSLGLTSVSVIGNYASLQDFDKIRLQDIAVERSALGVSPDDLIVAYISGFSKNREILPFIEAGRDLPRVSLQIWGDGHQRQEVQASIGGATNIFYRGWLQESKVPLFMLVYDAIYYCLRRDYPGAIYNAPNTLSNAMAAGRPILASDIPGNRRHVLGENGGSPCGFLYDLNGPENFVRKAIALIDDERLRRSLGEAGQKESTQGPSPEDEAIQLVLAYDRAMDSAKDAIRK